MIEFKTKFIRMINIRTFFVIFFSAISFLGASAQNFDERDLIGKWITTDYSTEMTLSQK